MKMIKELVMAFLFVGLLSCSTQNASVDPAEINDNEVHLELVIKSNYFFNQEENKPFIEGVDLVQHYDTKLLVKVDVNQVDLETVKRILNSKGFKVLKQYKKESTNSKQSLAKQRDVGGRIEIPEITFPNIFKALVVFYR
tara:strand:- start:88735 stop:89154 length:420 start_codon:yes stop_codon:yes gene_type:complete